MKMNGEHDKRIDYIELPFIDIAQTKKTVLQECVWMEFY